MSAAILAWHLVGDTLCDGRPVPADGEWLVHDGPVALRASGLHASVRIIDALAYAPGPTICRVEIRGDVQHHLGGKIVERERRILWRINGKAVLRAFARQCALDVIHLWNAPDVVLRYLETDDQALRDAAMDAAMDAARDVARDAARAAARASARAAAWVAARDLAGDAAWVAAGAAARDAARAAAGDAAGDAAWACAWVAANAAQNQRFTQMVETAHSEGQS